MAFRVYRRGVAATEPFITLPLTDSEAATEGEAMTLSSGALTKCAATTKPTHIAQQSVTAGTGKFCVCHRILPDMEYKVTSQATVAATLVGSAVTLHTDGLEVTATTTSGVATIVTTDGAKAVTVRFL